MTRRLAKALGDTLLGTLTLLAALGVGATCTASAAEALHPAPHWDVITRGAPTNLPPGGKGVVVAVIVNLGDAPVLATPGSPVTITDTLPARLKATGPVEGYATRGDDEKGGEPKTPLECSPSALSCTYVGQLDPFIAIEARIPVEVGAGPAARETNVLTIDGGNAPKKVATGPIEISAEPTAFGIEKLELTPERENGEADLEGGAHPFQLTTTIALNQTLRTDPDYEKLEEAEHHPPLSYPSTPELLRNLTTTLPAGLVADARASVFPQCSAVQFAVLRVGNSNECPADTAIGAAVVTFKEEEHFTEYTAAVPVFNLVPEPGEPARFGFVFEKVPVVLDTSLQTGAGYAVQVKAQNTSQAAELLSSVITIWGVPGGATHKGARGWECLGGGYYVEGLEPRPTCPETTPNPPPYLIMPTTCETLVGWASAQSWTQPAFGERKQLEDAPTLERCDELPFDPTFVARPDQTEASTPSGLSVEVNVPQSTTLAAEEDAEADVKATTVALPEEMTANGGAADGLGVCSTAAAGLQSSLEGPLASDSDREGAVTAEAAAQAFTAEAAACPDASNVGTVSIKTPLLENELKGNVYFGSQDTNPFGSPLVLYVIAEDPESGVRVKLAGEVQIDQSTGRLTSVFKNTPPAPFEKLVLHLYDGPRATQSTPAFCRPYSSNALFEPSGGGPPVARSSSFSPTPNADGQPCPAQGPLPFAPGLAASTNGEAGRFTPFSLTLARPDGDQALKAVSVTMPPGLAALLASVTRCPIATTACGSNSLVGHSTALAGLGSDPVTLGGDVYLTDGYGGAPFGLLDVTHAVAGPFNLGDVPVRSRIFVDPHTAAVTVVSDPLPQFVKGVPSQIKTLNVTVDRRSFELNPTNCSQFNVTSTLSGYEGASPTTSVPFRVSNCASLPFSPKLTSSASGHGSKANGTGFAVKIVSPGLGQAGIQKVFLTIPKILPSRLTTIQKACADAVFEQNPAACDEGSVIGEGIIHTPVLKSALRGPAYLVSHGNAAFPDVELVLGGEGVTIVLDGKTDIKKGVTYSRFEASPDAPFTSFEAKLSAGPHSAFTINTAEAKSYDICSKRVSLPTEITAHNGAVIKQSTRLAITGCGAVKASKESRSRKLAKALATCRRQFKHNKRRRTSCEAKARKRYGSFASERHK